MGPSTKPQKAQQARTDCTIRGILYIIIFDPDVMKWKHFPRYWHGHRWIPLTKAGDAELWCFPWSTPE